MNQSDLLKKKMPELRAIAKDNNIEYSIRWLKPKMISEIIKGMQKKSPPFEPVRAVPDDDFLADDGITETPTAEPVTAGRGGVRDGAGRPEGTEQELRLKKAIAVTKPDITLRDVFSKISPIQKDKPKPDDKLVDDATLYLTKTGEYLGIMEKLRNSPMFIILMTVIYSFKFVHYIISKAKDESASENNSNIRQAGNGQKQPSPQPLPVV